VLNKLLIDVEGLIRFGLEHRMINELDVEVVRNLFWKRLNAVADIDEVLMAEVPSLGVYELLNSITASANEIGEPLEYSYQVEQFQAELMSYMMPRNSEVNRIFWSLHHADPKFATEYFYSLSNASTYIRMDRVSKNISWVTETPYGCMDITINISKPEKDPKEIALAKTLPPSVYPKCLLCVDNAGYQGNINHPARHNHRIIEMNLQNEPWYLQYSPYVYYNEHAIVLCREHRDMKIDRNTFVRLCDFVDLVPHYFIGSNADLHTVGGSILTHDHYQAGNYEMPMMRAEVYETIRLKEMEDVAYDILKWPLSVVRLRSKSREHIIEASSALLHKWIGYSDERYELFAHTNERHNTVTPILRKLNGEYEMYLALRNNRKTDQHPDGIFHPHTEHHHIKKENIGLIEVMGLAVLPARLASELDQLKMELTSAWDTERSKLGDVIFSETTRKHEPWIQEIRTEIVDLFSNQANISVMDQSISDFLKAQVGKKFELALRDSGIYKEHYDGIGDFLKA